MHPQPTPEQIETASFNIIDQELRQILGDTPLPSATAPIVKRVIHASADFDFARNLRFSPDVVSQALAALRAGTPIVTDTEMVKAGINKTAAGKFGVSVHCLVADPEVKENALRLQTTRSRAAVDLAASRWPEAVYVVGNAPTALIRIHELALAGTLRPSLVVGVPVGFVNVVESKELILASPLPYIVSTGRKGGSTVAAAIVNALLYLQNP